MSSLEKYSKPKTETKTDKKRENIRRVGLGSKTIRINSLTYQLLRDICKETLPKLLGMPPLSYDICLSMIISDLIESLEEEIEETKRRAYAEAKQALRYIVKQITPKPEEKPITEKEAVKTIAEDITNKLKHRETTTEETKETRQTPPAPPILPPEPPEAFKQPRGRIPKPPPI